MLEIWGRAAPPGLFDKTEFKFVWITLGVERSWGRWFESGYCQRGQEVICGKLTDDVLNEKQLGLIRIGRDNQTQPTPSGGKALARLRLNDPPALRLLVFVLLLR